LFSLGRYVSIPIIIIGAVALLLLVFSYQYSSFTSNKKIDVASYFLQILICSLNKYITKNKWTLLWVGV